MGFLETLHGVIAGRDLRASEAEDAMLAILEGAVSVPLVASFLVALRMKGETTDELFGLVRAMRSKSTRVEVEGPLLDTCGTGGDGQGTFNVSTAAAFVAAGAGVRVAKHGNRSISSKTGSADVFEALGVKIALTPDQMAACIREVGIAFLFAPALHPAMKHAQAARLELKMRTVFNLLGPLANPAGASAQVIGAPSVEFAELMAGALARFGAGNAFVVHGSDGIDEITISGSSTLFHVHGGAVTRLEVMPSDFGVARAGLDRLRADSVEESVRIIRAVLAGEAGPARDIVVVNAAAALVASGAASDFRHGAEIARTSIDSGKAAAKVAQLAAFSGRL
ncbi:MAG: anthranilate phosphoribosyltransferase [Bryobacteraceae bacterium]